jgi:hypothetical protein
MAGKLGGLYTLLLMTLLYIIGQGLRIQPMLHQGDLIILSKPDLD